MRAAKIKNTRGKAFRARVPGRADLAGNGGRSVLGEIVVFDEHDIEADSFSIKTPRAIAGRRVY